MATSNELPIVQVDEPETSNVPFLSDASKPSQESIGSTSSSKLTSSDKLSALPSTSSPALGRIRTPTPVIRRNLDPTNSLPPSPPSGSTNLPPIGPHSLSEGSLGKETTKQRVSFDSDRVSLPSLQNVKQALSSPFHRHSDPSGALPRTNDLSPLKDIGAEAPNSHSHSRDSRANSPLRLFPWNLHRGHSREEPFVPIDPFATRFGFKNLSESARFGSRTSQDGETPRGHEWCGYGCSDCLPTSCLPPPASCPAPTVTRLRNFLSFAQRFFTNIILRQLYVSVFLLWLPGLYFSRVARIFEDAEVSRPDIQRMIDAAKGGGNVDHAMGAWVADGGTSMGTGIASGTGVVLGATGQLLPFPEDWTPPTVSPALARFKNSWEAFIDNLMREWKTQNIVSALLLSAILTLFQIPSAASDPVTRTPALLSLICALMSLSYGCIYIVRFGTMRSMYKASRWAEEARKTNTILWWNVWVLLAMPAVFLSWSMLLFIAAILSFVWRTEAVDDPDPRPPLSTKDALGPRIAITGVFGLGMIYFVLIVKTLASYGGPRNRESLWRVGSASNNGGSVGGNGGFSRERSGDADTRRGRERERTVRGGGRHRDGERARERGADVESDRHRDGSEREGEGGKDKALSGLRRVWGADNLEINEKNESINEVVIVPGSPDDIGLERGGVSEKITGNSEG